MGPFYRRLGCFKSFETKHSTILHDIEIIIIFIKGKRIAFKNLQTFLSNLIKISRAVLGYVFQISIVQSKAFLKVEYDVFDNILSFLLLNSQNFCRMADLKQQ